MTRHLTKKQIGLLETLAKGVIVAPWSTIDLVKLSQQKLVSETLAFGVNGRLHSSKIWTLTDEGCRYLDERGAA
ncbi:MAG: hypothetical protein WBL20_03030 [Sphingobium sp.]|uniref:hypothetical protein n=1 Tax=Sphingobium sp. TaxID=1912891 RepID=UPI002E1EE42E